jgi:hypothetical protein
MTILLVASLALLIAAFWISRYDGFIMEGDATRLTQAADGIVRVGRLVTLQSYSNGYGYPALVAFLIETTGLTAQTLQIAGSLWLVVLAVTAYVAYREFLGDIRLAGVAVLLLLMQPDFLFYILRSSHERTTWTFGLLILWLWVRSLRISSIRLRLPLILALYLCLWAIIANNAFFGSTIATAFLFSVLASYALREILTLVSRRRPTFIVQKHMLYILLSGFALVFLFTTYVYTPAGTYYYALETIGQKVSVLFLGSERPAVAATYGYVQNAWANLGIYFVLTGFQWLIMLAAAGAWVRDGVVLFRRGEQGLSRARLFLWFFYLGLAAQIALAVVADLSGAIGSNLQVRLFTPFALIASPLAATWLPELRRIPWTRTLTTRRVTTVLVSGIAALAIGLALLKVTNDPIVGNQWLFYSPGQQTALDWVDGHLTGRDVWIDTWSHQYDVMLFRKGYNWQPANSYESGYVSTWRSEQISHVLLSEETISQADRSGLELPAVADRDVVYDNGDAQLYHRRQRTPFEK